MSDAITDKITKAQDFIKKKEESMKKYETKVYDALPKINEYLKSKPKYRSIKLTKSMGWYNIGMELGKIDYRDTYENELLGKVGYIYMYTNKNASGTYTYPCGEGYLGTILKASESIKEKEQALAKHKQSLNKAKAKERTLATMPKVMVDFMNGIIDGWDKWDLKVKALLPDEMDKYYDALEEFKAKHHDDDRYKGNYGYTYLRSDADSYAKKFAPHFAYRELMHKTDKQIHDENVKMAKKTVDDLYNRVVKITGDITDAKYLRLTIGNNGFATINGIVIGVKGKANVQSVSAGGWNIQRYHIRTLVHEAH